MLIFFVSSSSRCTSSTLRSTILWVGRMIGFMKRITRSRIFLEARLPVEKIATSLPRTDVANAAQNWATEKVLPKRRGVTIMTSVRNSLTSISCCRKGSIRS